MNQIEDLLRQALQETPTPDGTTFPGDAIRRRVHRARRRLAVGTGIAAAVVAAAVVVPLAALSPTHGSTVQVGHSPSPTAPSSPVTTPPGSQNHTTLWPSGAVALVPDGPGLWAIVDPGDQTHPAKIVELDGDAGAGHTLGKVLWQGTVPGPVTHLVANSSRIWAFGGPPAGVAGVSTVDVLDEGSHHVLTYRWHGASDPVGIVFDPSGALVLQSAGNRVDLLALTPLTIHSEPNKISVASSTPVGTGSTAIVGSEGAYWIKEHSGQVMQKLVVSSGRPRLLSPSYGWAPPVFEGYNYGDLWSTPPNRPNSAVRLNPNQLGTAGGSAAMHGPEIPLDGALLQVLESPSYDRARAVFFVEETSSGPRAAVYSEADRAAARRSPSAVLQSVDVRALSGVVGTGVVYIAGDGSIGYWDPRR